MRPRFSFVDVTLNFCIQINRRYSLLALVLQVVICVCRWEAPVTAGTVGSVASRMSVARIYLVSHKILRAGDRERFFLLPGQLLKSGKWLSCSP